MNLIVVVGSAGLSAALSLIALFSTKRPKRVEHRFEIHNPHWDKPVIVSAKGQTAAARKARKLVKKEVQAAAKTRKLVESIPSLSVIRP
jgi:hypothetical protein